MIKYFSYHVDHKTAQFPLGNSQPPKRKEKYFTRNNSVRLTSNKNEELQITQFLCCE